ncbi:MAG: translocase [Candidatus Pelagibacter sp.]|jgi:predicted lipid-binding transport protein (Tim44 family)|nr:translocase [Candidatus Pelagibacter sp.]MDP6440768.1 Tim44/TimA family putative adaptor protein [Pelagibacteraceae bacterium]|tara:strand:- start:3254 stop:3853 length:600 start_codon:yes stop_codon:yes gene_type:complete
MNSSFEYLDIILLAIIAGFIILRLREILGRRTGHEKKDFGGLFGKKVTQNGNEKKVVNLGSGKLDSAVKEQFIKGAKKAYEMIITSFAKGDKKALKPLLNKKIFQNFSDEIDYRKKENLKSELTFVGVKSAEIKNFEKKDNNYTFTVDFVSEIITCKKDKNNNVIEGNPDIIKTVKDVWKFSKNMWSSNPNWYLVEIQV